MPPVGRPPSRTRTGVSAPINELGIPDSGLGGHPFGTVNALTGRTNPWRMYIDEWEPVPELVWPNSIPLFDKMRTDSQLAGLLTATMWGITQLRFVVDPNGCETTIVQEISEDLNVPVLGEDEEPRRRLKRRFSHGKHIFNAMLAVIYGHYHFEQVVDIVDGKARLRKLAPRPPHTIQDILIAEDGGLVAVEQTATTFDLRRGTIPATIPVDRLTAFIFQQEGMSQVGRSMLRDCYKDWVIKDRNVRIEAINHARAGGVPYAVAPMGSTDPEVEALHQMMRKFQIGEDAGAAVPYGTELKIAKGTGSDIDTTIKRIDESMARRFLLQLMNLAQGGQNIGSYALSENFEDSFLVGQRVIAQWYCDTMTEHVIEDLIDWNYGEDQELAPRLTWERSTEDSLGVDALATLVEKDIITVDDELEDRIRYRYLLPKRSAPRAELKKQQVEAETPEPLVQPTPPPGQRAAVSAGSTPVLLPAASDPAPVRAGWKRVWPFRKPDVQAAAPSVATVANVEILHAGVEYELSTGPATFTPEDLRDLVTAANEDPSIPSPRLKIGHIDPRFNGKHFDGTPAFGIANNLRLSENGTSVYADFSGVPRWLAEIMPYAYPSRSVEGWWNVESQHGKQWRFVLSACSLLGVEWPGVTVLEDLPQFYGEEVPEGVVIDAALAEAVAAGKRPGGDLMKVNASANLDDIRRAFYGEYVAANSDASWWWIQAVLTDPNELVVEDDQTGQLFKIPFKSNTAGTVKFGEAVPVRIDYIPEDAESQKAAASHVAATLAIGRNVMATYSTRAESRPDTTGGQMDPKEIRQRLGLPEDASDEQVSEAASDLAAAAGLSLVTTTEDKQDPPATAPVDATPPAPAVKEPEALPLAASAAPAATPGVVMVDEQTWAQVQAGLKRATDIADENDKNRRESLVTAAIGDGRVPPARKDWWLKALETDFEGYSQTLASLQTGMIPVEERGHALVPNGGEGGAPQISDEQVSGWSEDLFPEVRNRNAGARSAAAASAADHHSDRIQMDAPYRR